MPCSARGSHWRLATLLLLLPALSLLPVWRWTDDNTVKRHNEGAKAGAPGSLLRGGAMFMPPPLGFASDAWRPYIFNACLPGMDRHFAPCLAAGYPNLLSGEELVYPDFRLRLPRFVTDEHKATWLRLARVRLWGNSEFWVYPSQTGQNLIFCNATYNGFNPPATWWPGECMARDTVVWFPSNKTAGVDAAAAPFAAFLAGPDSNAIQHWLERTAHMLIQAEHHMPAVTHILSAQPKPGDAGANYYADLWAAVPGASEAKVRQVGPLSARRMLLPCRTPLIHPYLSLRFSEHLWARHGVDARRWVPLRDRRVVLLLARDHTARNHRRAIVNQRQLEEAITRLLRERGRGEELRLFRVDDFPTLGSWLRFLTAHVAAAIGVHGGAFLNTRFAAPSTLFVEIIPLQPDDGLPVMFWEEAAVFGHHYYAMPITAINDNKDVHVNVSHITGILRDSLGRPDPRGPPVLPAYYWNRVLPGCLAGNASREDCYTGETSTGPGGWGRRHSM